MTPRSPRRNIFSLFLFTPFSLLLSLCSLLLALCSFSPAFAEPPSIAPTLIDIPPSAIRNLLLPQDVYVGDTAELRSTFTAPSSFLPSPFSLLPSVDLPEFLAVSDKITIESCQLSAIGDEYTLTLRIIPWTPGEIEIPAFTIGDIRLTLPPIRVRSILERIPSADIRPPAPPILLPGTTIFVYSAIAAAVVLIILISILLVKQRQLWRFISSRLSAARRVKRFLKVLRRIERGRILESERYRLLSAELRRYLDARFVPGFSSATTSEMEVMLREFSGGEEAGCVRRLCDLSLRIDYIRFSAQEVSMEEERRIIGSLRKLIPCFEQDAEYEEEAEDAQI
jgi:hypothetical protein